jgi:prepilin-type N-terminal cleavage/methylation domain-containing protein
MKTGKNNLVSGFTLVEVIIALVVVAIVAAMMATYFGTSITQSSAPVFRLKAAGNLNQIMEKITTDYNNTPPTWSPNTLYAANTIILPTEGKRNGRQYIGGGTSGSTEPTLWPTSGTVSDGGVSWTCNGTTPPKNWVANTLYSVNAIVYPDNGYNYICAIPGRSHPTHVPNWSSTTTEGATITDGTVTWTCRGPQPTLALHNRIGNEDSEYTNQTFGGDTQVSYRVIHNRFIRFDTSGTEVSTPVTTGHTDYGKYLKVTIGLHSTSAPRTDETLTTLFVGR